MKTIYSILIVALLLGFSMQSQQIAHVISHNGETIVTNPAKGYNSYKRTVEFPSKTKEIRSIILNLTFECPDKMRCADWDYVDHIKAQSADGGEVYEIARMLTPYGGRFQDDWLFQWKVDVTDFSQILRNDVVIDYIHTGYEDNKKCGWKVTVDFEITYGSPVANPLAIHKIYDGNYAYGDVKDPIENHLIPMSFTATNNTAFSKIKVHQTGHGMDANGCGEFCNKYRDILFNGNIVDHKSIWKSCGDNPLYPQAGTWIFDRANWCPGYLLQPDEVLLDTKKGELYTVDLNMQPYETEKPSAKELLTTYVIEYGAINAKNDVTLVAILNPTTSLVHSRNNPSGGFPIIKIKNNGKKSLKKLKVSYGIENEKQETFVWKGNIAFGASKLITLPTNIFSTKKEAKFQVKLTRPNGKKDAFKSDNLKTSRYQRPHILPKKFVVYLKTNAEPKQNMYSIKSSDGNVLFQIDSLALKPNTVYLDTITLKQGNYAFEILDNGNDGLEFWYNKKAGRGELKLLDLQGKAIKHFYSDFGSVINYNFYVHPTLAYELDNTPSIALYPSRTKGPITVSYFSNTPATVKVKIVAQDDEKNVVQEHTYYNYSKGDLDFDLSYLAKKRYYVKVFINNKEVFKNRVRLKE